MKKQIPNPPLIYPLAQRNLTLNSHVALFFTSNHYFHFTYEALPLIVSLDLHGIFKYRYPNITIVTLCRHLEKIPPVGPVLEFFHLNYLYNYPEIRISCHPKEMIRYYVGENYSLIIPQKLGIFANYDGYIYEMLRNTVYINYKNPTRMIYLTRGQDRRHIQNEKELLKVLKFFLPQLEVYYLGNMTIPQQYEIFHNAKLIIGPHGNCFTNLIFAPIKNTYFIEFHSPKVGSFKDLFALLGGNLQHYYFTVELDSTDPSIAQTTLLANVSSMAHQIHSFLKGRLLPMNHTLELPDDNYSRHEKVN